MNVHPHVFSWICIFVLTGMRLPTSVVAQTEFITPSPNPITRDDLLRNNSIGMQLYSPGTFFPDTCDAAPTTEGTIIASADGYADANGTTFIFSPGRALSTDTVRITDLMLPAVCNFETGTWNVGNTYAFSPEGTPVSPLLVASNSGDVDGIYLPVEAYLEPGAWRLGASEPEAFEITISISPTKFFVIYDPYEGRTVVGMGIPGERVVIVNHNSAPDADGPRTGFLQEQTTLTLDDQGYGIAAVTPESNLFRVTTQVG